MTDQAELSPKRLADIERECLAWSGVRDENGCVPEGNDWDVDDCVHALSDLLVAYKALQDEHRRQRLANRLGRAVERMTSPPWTPSAGDYVHVTGGKSAARLVKNVVDGQVYLEDGGKAFFCDVVRAL